MLYLWLTFKDLLSQIAYFTLTLESKYADDTHLAYPGNDMDDIQSCLNADLQNISKWLIANNPSPTLPVNGSAINQATKNNSLGILIVTNLTWARHIDKFPKGQTICPQQHYILLTKPSFNRISIIGMMSVEPVAKNYRIKVKNYKIVHLRFWPSRMIPAHHNGWIQLHPLMVF